MTPARKEPTMPSTMVIMNPMFSLPGCRNLANTPMTNPSTIVQIIPMINSL